MSDRTSSTASSTPSPSRSLAKARIGHFVEAQILQSLGVDYIDESEVLTPARTTPPHRQVAVHVPVWKNGMEGTKVDGSAGNGWNGMRECDEWTDQRDL